MLVHQDCRNNVKSVLSIFLTILKTSDSKISVNMCLHCMLMIYSQLIIVFQKKSFCTQNY